MKRGATTHTRGWADIALSTACLAVRNALAGRLGAAQLASPSLLVRSACRYHEGGAPLLVECGWRALMAARPPVPVTIVDLSMLQIAAIAHPSRIAATAHKRMLVERSLWARSAPRTTLVDRYSLVPCAGDRHR